MPFSGEPLETFVGLFHQFNLAPVSGLEGPVTGSVFQFNVDRFSYVFREVELKLLPGGGFDGFLENFVPRDPDDQGPVSFRVIVV